MVLKKLKHENKMVCYHLTFWTLRTIDCHVTTFFQCPSDVHYFPINMKCRQNSVLSQCFFNIHLTFITFKWNEMKCRQNNIKLQCFFNVHLFVHLLQIDKTSMKGDFFCTLILGLIFLLSYCAIRVWFLKPRYFGSLCYNYFRSYTKNIVACYS